MDRRARLVGGVVGLSRRDSPRIARRFNAGLHEENHRVPKGRPKPSAVPSGLNLPPHEPGIEMPGYSRLFLRNKTGRTRFVAAPRQTAVGLTQRRSADTPLR